MGELYHAAIQFVRCLQQQSIFERRNFGVDSEIFLKTLCSLQFLMRLIRRDGLMMGAALNLR